MRRRHVAGALVLVLLALGTACGDDDAETGATAGELRLVYELPAGGQVPADLADRIVGRLTAIGIVVEGIDTGTPGEVTVELEDDRTIGLAGDLLRQRGVVRLRPVLAVVPGEAPDLAITPAASDDPAQPVVLNHRDLDGRIDQTYQLGPAVLDADGLATAEAEQVGDGPLGIRLVLDDAAVAGVEDAVAICFAKAVTCPLGQLAVTVDGAVLAAPEVAQPTLEDGSLFVTPQMGDAAMDRLASVLADGPLPVELSPVVPVDDEGT